MSDRDFLGMSDEERFDSLLMEADIANKERRHNKAGRICHTITVIAVVLADGVNGWRTGIACTPDKVDAVVEKLRLDCVWKPGRNPPDEVWVVHHDGDGVLGKVKYPWKLGKRVYPPSMTKYKVTGVLRSGRRFKAIHTDSRMDAMMINLWRGSVWQSQNGKWKLVHRVFN